MSGASDDLVVAVVAVGGFVISLLTVLRAITRPDRTPASRVAWIAAIMCLPVVGVVVDIARRWRYQPGDSGLARSRGLLGGLWLGARSHGNKPPCDGRELSAALRRSNTGAAMPRRRADPRTRRVWALYHNIN